MNEKLYVITSHFNPWRYKARVKLYNEFARYLRPYVDDGLIEFWTAEVAFGDRPFEVTNCDNPKHLQLRSNHELWLKEKSLNLLVNRLPRKANYIAWVDADLVFARPDWPTEIIQLLQHYDIIQNFSEAHDLSSEYNIMKTHSSIIKGWHDNKRITQKYEHFHPGFSWSYRRDALDKLGGFFDVGILGAGDRHMATSLMGNYRLSVPKGISAGYSEHLQMWQDRANKHIKGNVGYMPGAIFHHYHGNKRNRKYMERWQILVKHQYDPEFHIYADTQGLWQFADRNSPLHYDISQYFKERREDETIS
jgi:hypothetical protein